MRGPTGKCEVRSCHETVARSPPLSIFAWLVVARQRLARPLANKLEVVRAPQQLCRRFMLRGRPSVQIWVVFEALGWTTRFARRPA